MFGKTTELLYWMVEVVTKWNFCLFGLILLIRIFFIILISFLYKNNYIHIDIFRYDMLRYLIMWYLESQTASDIQYSTYRKLPMITLYVSNFPRQRVHQVNFLLRCHLYGIFMWSGLNFKYIQNCLVQSTFFDDVGLLSIVFIIIKS